MEQYRNIMVKYGDGNKRLWPTEFGWASSGNPVAGYEYAAYNSEQQQGEYIVRAYQMMRNWGWVGVAFLWNLNYNQTGASSEMAAFGIMGRSAYGMIQGMPEVMTRGDPTIMTSRTMSVSQKVMAVAADRRDVGARAGAGVVRVQRSPRPPQRRPRPRGRGHCPPTACRRGGHGRGCRGHGRSPTATAAADGRRLPRSATAPGPARRAVPPTPTTKPPAADPGGQQR